MSPSISDATYKSMVSKSRQSLVRLFADMPRQQLFDVMAVRLWARGFLSALEAYRNLLGDAEDLDVNWMVRDASSLVERFADDSWLEWAAELMPNFVARIEHAREEQERCIREEEERRAQEVWRAEENRRKQLQEEEVCRAAQKEKEWAEWEAVMGRLSLNSSRTAPHKTSQSSLASVDVDLLAIEDDFVGSQSRSRGGKKGKGKGKATLAAYQNPKFRLPKGTELVNKSCARCHTNYLTPFRCYVVPGKKKCVKCAHDKYPCSFEPEAETTSTSIVVTPKAKQASSSQSQVDTRTTPTASRSRVPRRPIIADDPDLDIADHNILNVAAEMIQRCDSIPSTTEGLMRAQDTVYHCMQANLYEMHVLLTQQHVGYEELDEIDRRLREIQDTEEIEEVDDGEEEEIDEIEDQLDP
ncbi:hypothetical protein PILCRDRAFT_1502 [Piloderma croceum F 1598]|uniref:Uncharacterized protein n=1 Tax=Piloderma croceum (strain F 1598) TaxID=765440 RepID=A0A0C3BUE2_PILCF|nr:hypothetical protein PILCRDRAFT_1502 [Piloderma croceum F 1598]